MSFLKQGDTLTLPNLSLLQLMPSASQHSLLAKELARRMKNACFTVIYILQPLMQTQVLASLI
jgi:hypothetical protein